MPSFPLATLSWIAFDNLVNSGCILLLPVKYKYTTERGAVTFTFISPESLLQYGAFELRLSQINMWKLKFQRSKGITHCKFGPLQSGWSSLNGGYCFCPLFTLSVVQGYSHPLLILGGKILSRKHKIPPIVLHDLLRTIFLVIAHLETSHFSVPKLGN